MLSHALSIVLNEIRRHFSSAYGVPESPSVVGIGNIAEGFASGSGGAGVSRDILVMSVVNI